MRIVQLPKLCQFLLSRLLQHICGPTSLSPSPGPIGPPGKNAHNTTPHPFITAWKHYIFLSSLHEPAVGTPGPPCPPGLCSTGRNTDKPTPHFSILNTGAYVCVFLSDAFHIYQKGQKVNQVRVSITSLKHFHTN